jgi:putative flippase GtrA
MTKVARRFFKFSSSTILGTVVDTSVLFVLSEWVFASYAGEYLLSPTISFEAAVINNYLFSYFWVWKTRVPRTGADFFRRFVLYNLNTALVFAGKLGVLVLINLLTGLHVVLCNLLALLVSGLANFFLQDRVIFSSEGVPVFRSHAGPRQHTQRQGRE